jgi:hypothetical protein
MSSLLRSNRTDGATSIEIGCLAVGMLFDSRPTVSLTVMPSIVSRFKRLIWPAAEIEPRALLAPLRTGCKPGCDLPARDVGELLTQFFCS